MECETLGDLEKLQAIFSTSVSFNSTQAALQDELNTLREALQESAASEHGDDPKRYMEEVEATGPLLSTSKLTYFGEKAKSDGQLGVSKKVGCQHFSGFVRSSGCYGE